jgi:cytidylate kinase
MRLPTVTFGGVDMYLPGSMPLAAEEFVERTERVIRETATLSGGVFLGRAGAQVLAGHPGALHVRLDGPLRRRVLQTAALGEVSEREARKLVESNDRARDAYVRHFYHTDPGAAEHYQLMIDSTVVPVSACVDLIVTAAAALS